MNKYLKIISLNILFGVILFSCNAPVNNPLDPENPDNKIYTIEGKVVSNNLTTTPIYGVNVFWSKESIQSTTDTNGYFKIRCTNRYDGWLHYRKDKFNGDSIFVSWGINKKVYLIKNLNSDPYLKNISFYSEIRNKYSQKDQQIVINVEIIDNDDNVDSVFLECEDLDIRQKLNKKDFSNFYGNFSNYDLSLSSLETVIGRDFSISVKEADDKIFVVGSSNIKRIINQEIEFISPSNQDTVSSTPTLRWRSFNPGFSFSFTTEVYTNDPEPQLMWRKDNIQAGEVSVAVDVPLTVTQSNDAFYWVIWCTDIFNNKSRSKPASFIVK